MSPARILMVHRYYAPDAPPYATMLRTLATSLAKDGHEVHVLSGMPTYNAVTADLTAARRAMEDGVHVRRLRLPHEDKSKPFRRALVAGLFLMGVLARIVRLRPDLVTFSTMPPTALGLVVRAGLALVGGRGRFVYHCQDLHPEVGTVMGGAPGLLGRVVARVEAGTRRAASSVVVLSEDMAATAVRGGARPDRVKIINNFPLVDALGPRPQAERPLRIVFAGNLGRFQRLDIVVAAAQQLVATRDDVDVLFLGDGIALPTIEAVVGSRIKLQGYVPPQDAFSILQSCDIGLVTLEPGMLDVAFPSKTMTYLAAGCLVVGLVDPNSSLARTVVAERLGTVAATSDVDGLVAAMGAALEMAGADSAARCEAAATRLYGRDVACAAWRRHVADMLENVR